jgi:hypothetical protein
VEVPCCVRHAINVPNGRREHPLPHVTLQLNKRGNLWRRSNIKILVAFEEDFRAYRETLAYAFQRLRPHVEVLTSGVETLDMELKRYGPQAVITSRPRSRGSEGVTVWVELSVDPLKTTKVQIGERCSQMLNPTLERLLALVDDLEQSTRTNGNC